MTTAYIQGICSLKVTTPSGAAWVDPAKWQAGEAWLHGVDCFGQFVTVKRETAVVA